MTNKTCSSGVCKSDSRHDANTTTGLARRGIQKWKVQAVVMDQTS